MISTQPGSTPLASFKILSLEETESHGSYSSGNDIGREGSAWAWGHHTLGRSGRVYRSHRGANVPKVNAIAAYYLINNNSHLQI